MNDPSTRKRKEQYRDPHIFKKEKEEHPDAHSIVSFRGEQDDEGGSEDNYSDSSSFDDEEDEDEEDSESFQEEGILNTKAAAADGAGTLPTRMSSSSTTDYHNRSGRRSRRSLHHKNSSNNNSTIEVENLAGNVADKLLHWRIVFLWILVSCGVAVSTGTYFVMERQTNLLSQQQAFNAVLESLTDLSIIQMTHITASLQGLSSFITASARSAQTASSNSSNTSSFPFVTANLFESQAERVRAEVGASSITHLLWTPRVAQSQRLAWEKYVQEQAPEALQQARLFAAAAASSTSPTVAAESSLQPSGNIFVMINGNNTISTSSSTTTADIVEQPSLVRPQYAPAWQISPPPINASFSWINLDLNQTEPFQGGFLNAVWQAKEGLTTRSDVSGLQSDTLLLSSSPTAGYNTGVTASTNDTAKLHAFWVVPIWSNLRKNSSAAGVGFLYARVAWTALLNDLWLSVLPVAHSIGSLAIVLENTCDQAFTFRLAGNLVTFVGTGNLVESGTQLERVLPLTTEVNPDMPGVCQYSLAVYDTQSHNTMLSSLNLTIFWTAIVASVFGLLCFTFVLYDCLARQQNSMVVKAAARANAVISGLFPKQVRDRLLAEEAQQPEEKQKKTIKMKKPPNCSGQSNDNNPQAARLAGSSNEFPVEKEAEDEKYKGNPIADLFPATTILFADIAGFTAWSSQREPTQVFILLETVFQRFDEIAKKRGVFKVETVGDCYVAVAGLPDPRKDHAVVMARFARDCMHAMRDLTKTLEMTLGPDTGELEMRMGLHSGPVTAGVLRGDRSRFQLFGDTMNTASRMESTGERGKIQLSQETTDLLIAAGKSNWVSLRDSTVVAKGKGELQTYWLAQHPYHSSEVGSSDDADATQRSEAELDASTPFVTASAKSSRLIDWNVDVLLRLLKQIVARRNALLAIDPNRKADADESQFFKASHRVLDEVQEVVALPIFDAREAIMEADSIVLDQIVVDQLYDYVSNIAAMYRENPFHNFEHASHVTMSVIKLLSRIIAPSHEAGGMVSIHDHTYGITNDPLTQFACVLSALIHDVDHPGVPNTQLIKEKVPIAEFYQGKSIAEQNSLDLAWHLLMDDSYADLRKTIYTTNTGLKRFRQLIVNAVMATDIVDKELKAIRNAKWDRAFSESGYQNQTFENVNRKATIVIEHLIQASDVAHTMQHWHIYRKWNERFYAECYKAFKEGRGDRDPTEGWYEGEIGFFDHYIIPLAKKLKDCGVFGFSGDEYLNYAIKNRKEWEAKGQAVVSEMHEKIRQLDGPAGKASRCARGSKQLRPFIARPQSTTNGIAASPTPTPPPTPSLLDPPASPIDAEPAEIEQLPPPQTTYRRSENSSSLSTTPSPTKFFL